jgi:chromosome segregation ATPase
MEVTAALASLLTLKQKILQLAEAKKGLHQDRDSIKLKLDALSEQYHQICTSLQSAQSQTGLLEQRLEEANHKLFELNDKHINLEHERDQLSNKLYDQSAKYEKIMTAFRDVFPYRLYREKRPDLVAMEDIDLVNHFLEHRIDEAIVLSYGDAEREINALRETLAEKTSGYELLKEKSRNTSIQLELLKELVGKLIVAP